MKNSQTSVHLFGLNIFSKSKSQLLKFLQKRQKTRKLTVIFTPNPEQVVQSQKNQDFHRILKKADILIPDGIGLVWASKILSIRGKFSKIKERVAGRELVLDLIGIAEEKKLKILLIGGRGYQGKQIPNSKFQISNKLQTANSEKNFIFWSEEYQNAETVIKNLKPDIVFVALGAPKQEYWIDAHKQLLEESGVIIAMAVGGSFDYLLGKVGRVPKAISKIGLEWLFRLASQPFRWKRQLRLIKFIQLVIIQLFLG